MHDLNSSSPSTHDAPGPEDLLYVACSQAGLTPAPSDFLLAIDMRQGVEHRAMGELHFAADREEVHSVGWINEDRSRLVVLGTRSSQLYLVDIASTPGQPRLEQTISKAAAHEVTGFEQPTQAIPFAASETMIVFGAGGPHGRGGVAVLSEGELRPLTNSAPGTGQIVDIAACPQSGCVAALCTANQQGSSSTVAVWDLQSGELKALSDGPVGACSIVATQTSEALSGFVAVSDGALFGWDLVDNQVRFRQAHPRPAAQRFVADLAVSEDGRRVYVADWLGGTLSAYVVETGSKLREAGRLMLGGRDASIGDAEGLRWNEMIRRAGREALAGPANLTLTPDARALVVTNGIWYETEQTIYPNFCSWLIVVDCHEDGSLTVDSDRIMTIVNRPAGQARYGRALTSWNGRAR